MPESGRFELVPTSLGPRVVRLDEGGVVTGRGAIRALIERELAVLAARDPSLGPRDLAQLRRQLIQRLREAFSGQIGSERELEWVSRVFWGWTPALHSPESVLARLTRPALTSTQRSLSVAELRWLLSRLDLPEGGLVRLVPYRKTLVAALLTPKGQVIPLAVASGRRWQWIRTPFAGSSWAQAPVQIALQRAVSRAGMDFPPAAALGQLVARLSARSVPDVGSALSESEQKTVSDFIRRVGELLGGGETSSEAYRSLIASIPEEMSAESIQAIAAGVRELREQIQEQAITPIEQAQGHLRQMAGALRESVVELAEARAMLGEAQAHMSRLYAALPSWMTLSDVAAMVPANLLERLEQATTLSPELASELASFLSEQAQALSRSEYTRAVWGTQEVLTDLLSRLDELRAMAYQQGVQVSQTAAERDAERTARFREVVEESVSAWAREVRLQQAYQDVLEQASRGYREIGVPAAPVDVERALMGIAAYDRPVTVRVGQREIEYRPPGLDVTEDVWQHLEQAQQEGRLVRRSSDELVYRIREVRRGEGVVLEPLSVPAHALRPHLEQALQTLRAGAQSAQVTWPEVSEEWLRTVRELARPVIPLSWGAQGAPERLLVDVGSLRAALGTQEPSQLVDVAAIFRSAGLDVPVDEVLRVPRVIWETVASSAPWSVFGRDWDEVKDAVQNMALAFSEALHDLGGMELEANGALAEQLHSRIMGRFLRRHIQSGIETAGLSEAERGMYIAVQQMLQEYAKTIGVDVTQMADKDILAARERLIRAYETFGGQLGYLSPIVDRRRLTDPVLLRIARDLQARMAVQTVHLETPTVGYRVGEVDERLQALWESYEMGPPARASMDELAVEELLRDVQSGEAVTPAVTADAGETAGRVVSRTADLSEALRRLPFPEAEPIVTQLHTRLRALQAQEQSLASRILERLAQKDATLQQDRNRAVELAARYTERAMHKLDRARRQVVRDAVAELQQVGVSLPQALSVVQAAAGSEILRQAYDPEELVRMLGALRSAMGPQDIAELMEGLSAVGVESIPVDVELPSGPTRGHLVRLSGGDVVVRLPGGQVMALEGLARPLSVPVEAVRSIRWETPLAFRETTAAVWGRRAAPFLESVAWDPESLIRPSRLRSVVIPHDPGVSLQNLRAFMEQQAPGLLLDIETTTLPERLPVDDQGRPIREAMALTSIQYEPVRWDAQTQRLVRGERVERLVRLPEATRRYVEELLGRQQLSQAEIAVLQNIGKFVDHGIVVEPSALEDPATRPAFLERLRAAARSGLQWLETQGIDPAQVLWEYRRAAAGRILIGLNVTGFDIPVLEQMLRESLRQDRSTWRRLLRREFRQAVVDLPPGEQRVLARLWKQVESQGLSEAAFTRVRQALSRAREAGLSETAFRRLSRLFSLYEERPAIEMRFLPSWARVSVPDRRLETLVGYLFGAESEVFRAYRETAHVSDLPATGAVFEALTRRVSGMAFPQPLEAGHWVGVVRAIGGRYDRPQVTRGVYHIERLGRERLPLFGKRPAYRVELAPLGGGPTVVLRTTTHQELQYLLARHTVRLADEAQAQAFADYLASDDLRRAFERASWSARSMRFYLARDVAGVGRLPEEALASRVAALQAEWEQGRRLSERPLSPTEQVLVESYRMLGGEAGVRRARIARAREVPARQLRWRRALSQVLVGPTREAILPFLEEVEALQASGLWSSSQARRATRRFLDRIKQFAARRPVPHLADLGTLVATLGNRAIEIPMVVDTLNEAQALAALRRAAFRIYRQARELGIAMPFAEAAAQVLGHLRRQNLAASTLEEAASVLVAASRAGRLRSATVEDWSRGILGDLSEDVTEEQIRRRVAEVQAIGREVRSEMMREQREAWRTYRQQMSEALASQGAEMPLPEPPRDVAPVGGVMEAARFRMARQIQRELAENPELAAAVRLYAPSGRPYLQPDVRGELVSIPDWYQASGEQMSRLEDLGARMEQTRRSVQELQRAIDEAVRNRSGDVGDLRRRLQETWQTQRRTLRELERLAAYAGDPVRRRAQELLGWAEEQGLEQTLITRGEFAGWRLGELTARRDWEAVRSRLAQAASAWQSWRVTSPLGGRLARFLSEPAPVASVGIEAAPAVSRTASTSARRAASPRPGALSQAVRAAASPVRQATREQIDRIFEASVHRSRSALRRWYEERGAPWLPWVGGLALAGWAFRQMTRKDLVVSEPAWQRERMPQVPAQVEVYPAPETRPRRGLSIRLRARSEGQVDESRLQPILEQSLKNALGIPVRAHVQLQDDRSRLTQEWVDGVVSQLLEEGYVSHA